MHRRAEFLWGTIRVDGVPNKPDAPARTHPLMAQVEVPEGHSLCEAYAEMGGGMPCCECAYWCHRWGSFRGTIRVLCESRLWGRGVVLPEGHDPCEGCSEMGGEAGCESCFWGRK